MGFNSGFKGLNKRISSHSFISTAQTHSPTNTHNRFENCT